MTHRTSKKAHETLKGKKNIIWINLYTGLPTKVKTLKTIWKMITWSIEDFCFEARLLIT